MDLFVVVYNPMGSNTSSIVQLPVSVDKTFDITNLDSNPLTTARSVRPVPSSFSSPLSAEYILAFDTGPLPPVSATVFQIKQTPENVEQGPRSEEFDTGRNLKSQNDIDEIEIVVAMNKMVSVKFDRWVLTDAWGSLLFSDSFSQHLSIFQCNWGNGVYQFQRCNPSSVPILGILHIL